ncbi:beta-ketoacyl synthase N-terminal-like domain-containing protein, partial [Streptomonospora nanhaiensis]
MGEPMDSYDALFERSLARIEELEAEVAALRRGREPVAVVGMGCRFPGAEDPRAFWRLLERGGDATREVPADRWDPRALAERGVRAPARGGFVGGLADFDAEFFKIAPREAARMDPQHWRRWPRCTCAGPRSTGGRWSATTGRTAGPPRCRPTPSSAPATGSRPGARRRRPGAAPGP